jgi:protein-tyrosine phosphatase
MDALIFPLIRKVLLLIDIHCHILPFIDDGPRDWDESIRMAMIAVNNGIHTVIATPHHGNGRYVNPAGKIQEQVALLNTKLQERNIPLTILPGQEFFLHADYQKEYEGGNLQTLGGSSCLLVELPTKEVPIYFDEFIQYMHRSSIQIVVAHPERYAIFIQKPRKLAEWVDKGIMTQITAASLLGIHGRKIQKTAIEICKLNLAHFIASDAHNTVTRGFLLRESYYLLSEVIGKKSEEKIQNNGKYLIYEKCIPS